MRGTHHSVPRTRPLSDERQDVRLSGGVRARPPACGWADRLHHGQGLQQREAAELRSGFILK